MDHMEQVEALKGIIRGVQAIRESAEDFPSTQDVTNCLSAISSLCDRVEELANVVGHEVTVDFDDLMEGE
jgi:hypothetical protein